MIQNPIFIIGTERSGSNLLRVILNSHSQITVPHPPHIVHYFAPLEPSYGDLSNDRAFRELVRDIVQLLDTHIYPWGITVDLDRAVREAPARSAFGVYAALYEQYREHSGKARWACKSTFMIDHAPTIMEHFPQARLILLVRDPRDVAVSSKKSVFSTFHPYYTARLWRRQQMVGHGLLKTLSSEVILLVRYEELIAAPREVVDRICAFIQEDFEPGMLRYFETAEARKSASLAEAWRNTAKPIMSDNAGKFRTELSEEELWAVETVARDAMALFGYEPVYTDNISVPGERLAQFWVMEQVLWLRTELQSLSRDRNFSRRLRRRAFLEHLRLRRRVWPAVAAALPWGQHA